MFAHTYTVYNNNNNNNSLSISFLGVGKIQWIYMKIVKIVKKDLHEKLSNNKLRIYML